MSIRLENVSKRFGAFSALRDINLDARPGEFLALLGPSGSGKTTLLRIIAGLEFPDTGAVFFDEGEVTNLPISKRQIGFVFQHYALFRHMTVADNIAFGLTVRRRRNRPPHAAIDARVAELLDLVQLGELGRRYPSQLSGGQRQRVALARALAVEPRLLLLDEPFGALDAKVRKDLRRWLRELHDRMGLTSIFVTHDQDEALELADQVVVLDDGIIQQVATPDHIYNEPASAFVFRFVGESNELPVTISQGQAVFQGKILCSGCANGNGVGQLLFRPHDVEMADPQNGIALKVTQLRPRNGAVRIEGQIDGLEWPILLDLSSADGLAQGQILYFTPTQALFYP
ncbi:sulfate/molybdate ABC transporter ATP-binding protein [Sphingobium sp. EM0848]|uniref:sulfate/molybdate ABC transporter ATP-binding protein n=1 Tax=Sphingobium sp. EM0848 TaxID=2743473 RepID=UPI00159C04BE|nr:sulfate/molybdate ABC transporter ATP-binding protein [Sphingobium sp. EM0848]